MAGYQTLARYYDSFFEPGYLQKLHTAYARLLHAAGVPGGSARAGCRAAAPVCFRLPCIRRDMTYTGSI